MSGNEEEFITIAANGMQPDSDSSLCDSVSLQIASRHFVDTLTR
jgi:hypothetical protein